MNLVILELFNLSSAHTLDLDQMLNFLGLYSTILKNLLCLVWLGYFQNTSIQRKILRTRSRMPLRMVVPIDAGLVKNQLDLYPALFELATIVQVK